MDVEAVSRVRSFNRVVTQRIGALDEAFLSLDRPLGPARVLWEIGTAGADVRALRQRLDLDSGYLSRLLRSLERDGLVAVETSADDRRVRTARLTPAGLAERAELDRRSDDVATSVLDPLTEGQRSRLVAAMAEVERLLTASTIRVEVTDPRDPGAREARARYFAELGRRFPEGFDPAAAVQVSDDDLTPPAGLMLLATLHGAPVGCAVAKFHDGGRWVHAKRMWVDDAVRGIGLGRRLLTALEDEARERGAHAVRLETHDALHEAIRLYRTAGYREIAPFNDEVYAHLWFEKELGPAAPGTGTGTPGGPPDRVSGPAGVSAT
jgi:DNA-binding MarR family transcriptional regulator/GNAT superfamily N-acetyltransferase